MFIDECMIGFFGYIDVICYYLLGLVVCYCGICLDDLEIVVCYWGNFFRVLFLWLMGMN